jgi:peroxiredoxin
MPQKDLPQDHPRLAPANRIRLFLASITLMTLTMLPLLAVAQTPDVGSKAPDFTLSTPEGALVRLSELTAKGKVVLIVLRGYPGYQCPYCQRQAHDFQANAGKFTAQGVQLLLVYPGPPADLDKRAQEFLAKQDSLPANFHLVIDPDYKFTNQYGLRWDAPHETAYPSTFLIDQSNVITARKISHSHGDRATADDVLADLAKTK